MLSVLKILVLEKKEKDMESIQRVLHKAGLQFQIKKVDNRVCFEEALEQYVPEIILANHRVNNFEAAEALLLSRTKLPDIPFIMVTDKVSESYAVDMTKLGVSDYFLKDDLSKLPLAIQDYILKKPSENQNKVILENKLLQRSLTRNVAFLKAIPDLIFVLSRSGIFTDFHAPEGMETYVSPEAFLGKNILEVIPEPVASQTLKNIELVLNRELVPVHEYQLEYPDGLHDFGAKYAALGGNEVLVIVRDITKQKSVEREIHKEKIVSESLINSLPGVFYLITAEGKFLRWNRNFEEATGYSGEEIKDLYPLDLFADDEKGLLLQKIANVFKTGEDSIEANFLLKTGERKFYYLTGKAIVYDEKDCLIGVGIDLSERRDAEEAIEHNEKKLRTLVDQAADGILITDKNLRFTEVNNKFCGMVGYTREELLQMRMPELVSNYWNKPPLGLQKVKLDSSTLTETYFTRKNGTVFPVEINASLIENSSYLSFVRDITERRKINDLIGGEKKVMEMIATGRSIKEILDVVALNYEVICKNTLCSILLLDRESSRLYLGAAPHLPEDYNRAIDGAPLGPQAGSCGTAAYRKERVIVSDISRSPLWKDYKDLASSHNLKACWSNPILNKNDEVMGVFAIYAMIARNPTTEELQMVDRASYLVKIALERNENEIELRKREEKFRTLVESVSDAFVALDTNWKYTYVNRKAGELLNRDPAYLTGKHIWTEFPDAMGKPFQVAYEKAMRDQQQASLSEYFPDNNRWIENNIYPSPEGISVYFKDVTRQKLAEQKMIKNSRLYFFISQFNQMIIHARCEGILFKEACDIAVNVGNFKLAWIGILNNETHTLEPVMFSGKDEGYLSKLNIVVDKKNPTGEGPASTAIFSGKTICCNDIENDPKMIPWRTEALKRNFRSSIGLPIKKSGKVTGVFNLYSDVKGFFDEEEIALLERATDDISFALEIFENEKLKKKTDDEIGRSKRQFQNLVESISGVYWVNDVETYQTLYISPSYLRRFV
jgi:PAS domain S-box-containing protein